MMQFWVTMCPWTHRVLTLASLAHHRGQIKNFLDYGGVMTRCGDDLHSWALNGTKLVGKTWSLDFSVLGAPRCD
jgi:hypothetical protein